MVRTEVFQALESLVKTLLLAKKKGKIAHGAAYGPWGTGKTTAIRELTKNYPVFYLKVPRDLTRTRLVRLFGFALGAGAGGTYDFTLDLIRGHIQQEGISPLFAVDESQRLFQHRTLLDELKDLSEDPTLSFSYLFLGDHSLKSHVLSREHHSIVKRVIYKVELSGGIKPETINALLKEYNLKGNPEEIAKIVRKRKWKILDLDNTFYLAQLKGIEELNEETVDLALKGTEVRV